jgi:2-methylcitrate dehydratase
MERYTEILVEYLGSLSYKDLSPEVVDKVKYLLYDYLGHTVYSCGETPANILCDVSRELGGVEEATVIGYGYRTNAVQATL